MRYLASNNQQELIDIIAQIDAICGWPNGVTLTSTIVQWSDNIQMYWCCIEDGRIIGALARINHGHLPINNHIRSHLETEPNPKV